MSKEVKLSKFIEGTIKNSVKEMCGKNPYIGFGLISVGIEFLGACMDGNSLHSKEKELSQTRFNNAIKELFPEPYHAYISETSQTRLHDLYSNLRCGMMHVFIPAKEIEIIQKAEIPDFSDHLTTNKIRGNKRLVLVLEELLGHYLEACDKILNKIEQGEIEDKVVLLT